MPVHAGWSIGNKNPGYGCPFRTIKVLAKTPASARSSAVFYGRAASRRAIARYLSGRMLPYVPISA